MRIVKCRYKSSTEFLETYSPDPPPGSMFCATTTRFERDELCIVELYFPELPNRVMIRARVLSWRPATPRLRVRAGALVAFDAAESDKAAFVLGVAGGTRKTRAKRRHTRLPVTLPTRWRLADSTEYQESGLEEISVGGALLRTRAPIPLGKEVVVEVLSPGGVQPMPIAAKAAYHTGPDGTGIRFISRDGGGLRRIRELIRRLKVAQ